MTRNSLTIIKEFGSAGRTSTAFQLPSIIRTIRELADSATYTEWTEWIVAYRCGHKADLVPLHLKERGERWEKGR